MSGHTEPYDAERLDLDVIIPTRDRSDRLQACLEALSRQSGPRFGVIVVDDGSLLDARDLVPPELQRSLGVRFVRNERSIGPGPSRNRGALTSEASYLVFLDDDCAAGPETMARHHARVAAPGPPTVSLGPCLAPAGRQSTWTHWSADRLTREYDRLGRGDLRPQWRHLYSGNFALRRADFCAVNGFDSRFARQEDLELGYRLHRHGCRFEFDPHAVVEHNDPRGLRSWLSTVRASARFDVAMDRLVPSSRRLSVVREELRAKHWAIRVVRRLPLPVQRTAVCGAIAVGCLLHALRIDGPALAAFSLVWDLEYGRALRRARPQIGRPRLPYPRRAARSEPLREPSRTPAP